MSDIQQWHDKTLQEHEALRNAAAANHFRYQSLSLYGTASHPLYAAVMIQWPSYPAQHDFSLQTLADLNDTIADQKAKGFGPAIISATGPAGDPRFAVVFEKLVPGQVFKSTLTSGASDDTKTIQSQMAAQKAAGLILHWACSYGDAANPRFAAIWRPQNATDPQLWNGDGVLESSATYQQRFNAQTSTWARPFFVTLNKSHQYLSAFVANEAGGWWARHDMTSDDFASEYATWVTSKKFTPVCVQASGDTKAGARFASIFVQNRTVTPRAFHANGPVANASIDAVVEKGMRTSPVRTAALAIVHKKQLVYVRGYTCAEPSWPLTQPTTPVRLASNSKTVTAMAAWQMVEKGQLGLEEFVQDILHLTTPSGGTPADARFKKVKVRHLLEHSSGINTDAFRDGPAVRDAWIAAGHAATLPASHAQTDAYIASLPMVSDPGMVGTYNNCGYYLLGRVLTKRRQKSDAIGAYAQLFSDLHITRIRNAASLVSAQAADEARYQTAPLSVYPSQISDARPLVPDEYGSERMETLEGAGGFSGAATDLARLIAILLSDVDNPAMKRSTINDMMNKAVANGAALHSRSGYGWDGVSAQGNNRFYAQKGGSLDSNHSVIQINGDWGFTMLWAGNSSGATGWYPDYPDVMSVATTASWSATDLFPQFGMPSL